MIKKDYIYHAPLDNMTGSSTKKFCPNCGTEVSQSDNFCPNCNFNLRVAPVQQQVPNQQEMPANQTRSAKPPISGKTKFFRILIGAIIIIILGGYYAGTKYYSKENQINRMTEALKTDKNMKNYFSTSDTALKITDSSMKPASDAWNSAASLKEFKNGLTSSTNTSNQFQLKENGKHWLLFPKYTANFSTVSVKLSTNTSGAVIKMNDKKIATANSDDYSKTITGLVPGSYKIEATGAVDGTKLNNESTEILNSPTSSVNLDLSTITFRIKSIAKADIYVNSKKVGTTNGSGTATIGPIASSGNNILQLKEKVGDNTLVTSKYKISGSDDDNSVTLDSSDEDGYQDSSESNLFNITFPDMLTLDDAQSYMDNLFSHISDYTSEGDDSDEDSSDSYGTIGSFFVGGESNADAKSWIKIAESYYNNDSIESVDYATKVKTITPTAKNKFDVTYDVTYTFDLTDSDDDYSTKTQVFEYTAKVNYSNNDDFLINSITPAKKISEKTEDN
ncbi:TcaA 3rd/4th domain-containing protein [Dellaglioa sp. BT-FLS60]